MNRKRQAAGKEALMIGIGISTGEVISGNIGSRKRMDFTVIGDDVNISQHLEKINRLYGTEILISESTLQKTKDMFVVRFLDEVLFKNRKKPVRIYEVLGEAGYQLSLSEEKFCEALTLYHKQNFAKAKKLFAQGAKEDRPCQVFLSRCSHYLDNPPPENWNGTWVETSPDMGSGFYS
jgi:adenylate cyclase